MSLVSVSFYLSRFGSCETSLSHEVWGQFGDYIGGTLNPGLAFLSLMAVLIALQIQFRQSQDASQLQSVQHFETALFELMRIHRENRSTMRLPPDIQDPNCVGIDFLWHVWRQIRDRIRTSEKNLEKDELSEGEFLEWQASSLREAYENAYDVCDFKTQLAHYFRNLYHTFKYIEVATTLDQAEKTRYARLVRAQLSSIETTFLFLNGLHGRGTRFRLFLKKYALLQELLPSDLPLDGATKAVLLKCYPREAYYDPEDLDEADELEPGRK